MKRLFISLFALALLASCATFDPTMSEAPPGGPPSPMILDGTTVKPRNDAWSLSAGTTSVEVTATSALTTQQCLGTILSNYGMAGATDTTLAAVEQSSMMTVVVETAGQTWSLKPPTGEVFTLDGTALDANDEIDVGAVAGDKLTLVRRRTGAATWAWDAHTVQGVHTDGGAS